MPNKPKKKTSPKDPAKIDTSKMRDKKMKKILDDFLSKHGKHKDLTDLLKDLPAKVKEVELRTTAGTATWSSYSKLRDGKIVILINPKYEKGQDNPGGLLFHEIAHQTRTVTGMAKKKARAWIKENPETWQTIVDCFKDNKHMARKAVEYGFEEPECDRIGSAFAKKIGEEPRPIRPFERAVNYFIWRWAPKKPDTPPPSEQR